MFPVPVPKDLCSKSKDARCCLITAATEQCDEKKIAVPPPGQEMSETSIARIPREWLYVNLNDGKDSKNALTLFRPVSEGLSTKEKNELGREMKRWAIFDDAKRPVFVYELPDLFGSSSSFHFLTPDEVQSVTNMTNPSPALGVTPNQKYKLISFLTDVMNLKKKAGGGGARVGKTTFYFSTGTPKKAKRIPVSRAELAAHVQITNEHADFIVLAPAVRLPSKSARKKNPDAKVLSWTEFAKQFF